MGGHYNFLICGLSELDEKEVEYIKKCSDSGIQMYNVTAGSQGKGKQVTGQYKQPKTYSQGIQQGRINLARELANIADKHLVIGLKPEKQNNSVSQKTICSVYGTFAWRKRTVKVMKQQ